MSHRRFLGTLHRCLIAAAGVAAVATLGVVVALLLASPARAYSIGDLAALGYSVAHGTDSSPPPGQCPEWYEITGHGSGVRIGTCDLEFQSKLDAFVQATCPCAQTTAAPEPPPATTAVPTTTETVTTTTTTATTPAPAAPSLPAAPTADFTAASVNPDTIQFTDTSTVGGSAIGSRIWQFGDGTIGLGSPVSHVYPGPGAYAVGLIVLDGNGLGSLAVHELVIAADHRTVSVGPRLTQMSVAAPAAKPAVKPAVKPKAKPVVKKPAKKKRAAKKKARR